MVRTEKDKLIIEVKTSSQGSELQQLLQGLIYVVGKAAKEAGHDTDGGQHIGAVTDFMLELVPDERQLEDGLKTPGLGGRCK